MHVLYQYDRVLRRGSSWVLVLAIVELIFYIHREGERWKRKAKASASLPGSGVPALVEILRFEEMTYSRYHNDRPMADVPNGIGDPQGCSVSDGE
jgi:hypothetical protein